METTTVQTTYTHRPMTAIVCSRCKKDGHVPFTPTPGRAILCGDCHRKARTRALNAPRIPLPPPKRMLSMRRKGHFTYDALQVLDADGDLEDRQKRAFVEMVFARGSRQTTRAAIGFLEEKTEDGTITTEEGERLARVVQDYSRRR